MSKHLSISGKDAKIYCTWKEVFWKPNTHTIYILVLCLVLTLPGLCCLYCSTLDVRTTRLTQASAMWWHSSGTLMMPGCTKPQL